MIGAGELNRRAVFYKRAGTARNALNEPVGDRVVHTIVKARRRDLSDAERLQAGREDVVLTARFVVRSRPRTRRIAGADDFDCDGRVWKVVGIKQLDRGRNGFLEITAVSLDDAQG